MRLFLLLLLAVSVSAQEPQEPAPVEPTTTEEQAAEPVNTELTSVVTEPENPALRLGHPLDPADVATLTGRSATADSKSPYDTRAVVYVDPGWNRRWAGDAEFDPLGTAIFGRGGQRPAFVFSLGKDGPAHLGVPACRGLAVATPHVLFPQCVRIFID